MNHLDVSKFVKFHVSCDFYTNRTTMTMKVTECNFVLPNTISISNYDDEKPVSLSTKTMVVKPATYRFVLEPHQWKEWEHLFGNWLKDHPHPMIKDEDIILQMRTDLIKWGYDNPGHWLHVVTATGESRSAEAIVIQTFPALSQLVKNPVTGRQASLKATIIKLNDTHKWSREKIADWLETLDLDINAKDPKDA